MAASSSNSDHSRLMRRGSVVLCALQVKENYASVWLRIHMRCNNDGKKEGTKTDRERKRKENVVGGTLQSPGIEDRHPPAWGAVGRKNPLRPIRHAISS